MSERINPRRLLSDVRTGDANTGSRFSAFRLASLGFATLAGFGAFASMVVKANDDQGVLAFVRQQSRPAWVQSPAVRPAPVVSPVAYYPSERAVRQRAQRSDAPRAQSARSGQGQRPPVAAAYAPFSGFFSWDAPLTETRGQSLQMPATASRAAKRHPSPSENTIARSNSVPGGSRVAYCVRTCDGFFFPVNVPAGQEDLACNRMCPTAETKVYFGQIGRDVEEARSSDTGRRYAQLANALSYRRGVDKSCSCSVDGFGLTNSTPIARDPTLRAGDIVMTEKGLRVFNGGNPGRTSNYTSIDTSRLVSNQQRRTLKAMEQASKPSGSLRVASRAPALERGMKAESDQRFVVVQNAQFTPAVSLAERSGSSIRVVGPEGWSVIR